jgi:hypothetical protein
MDEANWESNVNQAALLATAYHEAVHAVVGWSQGFKIQSITIVPDATTDGSVAWRQELEDLDLENLWGEKLDEDKPKAERLVTVLKAGGAA